MSYTPKRAMPVTVGQENKKHGQQGNSVSKRKKESARNKRLGIEKPAAFNIKANTQSNINSKWKTIKRLMDREHTKHHILLPKRITQDMEEPPIYVAVVGPPQVGKSLLIRSLIKHYTATNLTDCRGPMTILANNHRRITFLECPNELNAMIDVAKTCDLALLLVDASYGFEMETFEFLNCAQLHGFPRVMGVLTHLDKYVKLQKKQSIVYHVKHRFWKEIYSGAKLFVLKGIDKKIGQVYFKTDVRNLVRFISVLKFRPLQWRNSHPYLLVDRFEDMSEPAQVKQNPKMDRTVAFYGYVRGCNFRSTMNIHICGVGDFMIKEMEEMEDPVPLPHKRMRHLVKTGRVYAPMANIGPVVFDKHAAYITLRDKKKLQKTSKERQSWESDKQYLKRLKLENLTGEDGIVANESYADIHSGVGKKMIDQMSKVSNAMDEVMKNSMLQIFPQSKPIMGSKIVEWQESNRKESIKETTASSKINDQKTTPSSSAKNNYHVESVMDPTTQRVRRRVRFDDETEEEKSHLFDRSEEITENQQNQEEEEEDQDYDFNAVDEWIASDKDAQEYLHNNGNDDVDDDIDVNGNVDVDGDDVDIDGDDVDTDNLQEQEQEQEQEQSNINNIININNNSSDNSQNNKQSKKKEKNKQKQASNTVSQSNAKWKQNLLANAEEIWKRKITLAEWVYGEGEEEEKKGRVEQSQSNRRNNKEEEDDESSSEDEFFRVKKPNVRRSEIDMIDSSVVALHKMTVDNWEDPSLIKNIKNRFVTGDWVAAKKFQAEVEKRAHNLNPDVFDPQIQEDRKIIEELGGITTDNPENEVTEDQLDWEYRLEQMMKAKGVTNSDEITMEDKIKFAQTNNLSENTNKEIKDEYDDEEAEKKVEMDNKIKKKEEFDRMFDSGILQKENVYDQTGITETEQKKVFEKKGDYQKKNVKRDRKGKKRGQGGVGEDEVDRRNLPGSGRGEYWMDMQRAEMEKQLELNKAEFENEPEDMQQALRGHIPGAYVRIIIEGIPSEFDMNFDLRFPVILGGLLPQEMEFGFIQARIKKHRWYKRLLKFNDPLIISMGWRRYQTIPLYCMEDRNQKRLRLIKYTPEHMHCLAIFYGPISQPGFGFIGYVECAPNSQDFRISATGTVLSCNTSYKIVKKLKIMGEPYEIHRNTCFVKGMFNSNLEVAKFMGAKIQTVSGVRGSIKKAEGRMGNFRATFEDRLLKSDIIFLKSWVPIAPQKFYNPVRSLLLTFKDQWKGMRTVGQLRAEKDVRPTFKEDSVYKSTGRKPIRQFNTLKIPKSIQTNLPFNMRQKIRQSAMPEKLPMQYPDREEKESQNLVHSISEIAASHAEVEREQKRKKRKRERSQKKEDESRARKRRRTKIRERLRGHEKTDKFEATRGDKFHKEWRLYKQPAK